MTGQIQKGKYIYYHCSNGKGKCNDKYVREEIIAEQFAESLKKLQITEAQLKWIIPVLKSSHQEEIEFHENRVNELQDRYKHLTKRIEMIYEDKLDGKIPEELWFRKNEEYKQEMGRIQELLRQHTKGNFDYVESGVRILELAQNAHRLYSSQSSLEQRRILNFLLSNCTLKAGEVSYTYKKPFDLIANMSDFEKDWAQ